MDLWKEVCKNYNKGVIVCFKYIVIFILYDLVFIFFGKIS